MREELALGVGLVTAVLFWLYGEAWLAFNVVRHADCLAILR